MRPQKVFTTREMCLSSNEKNKEIYGRENVRVQLAQSIFVQYNYSMYREKEKFHLSIQSLKKSSEKVNISYLKKKGGGENFEKHITRKVHRVHGFKEFSRKCFPFL